MLAEFRGHRKPVWALAFSPDGGRLVSGDGGGQVKMWEAGARRRPRLIPDAGVVARSLDLGWWGSPGARTNEVEIRGLAEPDRVLATVPRESAAGVLVALADGVLLRREETGGMALEGWDGRGLASPFPGAASADVVLEPLARFVAYPLVGSKEYGVFEVAGGREVGRWAYARGAFRALDYSADGRWLALGDVTGGLRVLRLADGGEQLGIAAHGQEVYAADFTKDGSQVATAGQDGWVRLWEVGTGRRVGEYRSTVETYWSVALSPDGTRVAAGTGESGVVLWNVQNQLEVAHYTVATEPAPVETGLAFSRDGAALVMVFDGRLRVWGTGASVGFSGGR